LAVCPSIIFRQILDLGSGSFIARALDETAARHRRLANKILDKEWKKHFFKFCSMSIDQMSVGQNLDIV
jgi:hypothetical protein